MKHHLLPILQNKQVSSRYWHMIVDSSQLNEKIIPGQFFNILCGDKALPFLRRPFSIYRINKNEQTIEFLYLVQGMGTKEMTRMKKGELLDILGPFGIGFEIDPEWKILLLLARGVGIATLAALAQEATDQGKKCIAILSARSHEDLLATEELQSLGATVFKVTEQDGTSDPENVKKLISEIAQSENIDAGFTCGSKRLSRVMKESAFTYQFPAQIALEEHMACAMGACFACVCNIEEDGKTKSVRVCTEGPVFDLAKVVV